MKTIIVGSGKLASELLRGLNDAEIGRPTRWSDERDMKAKAVVVHAGSGRELKSVIHFCERTQSPLVELSTGSELERTRPAFPVVLCPNTNILMLKFMSMLKNSGALFSGYSRRIIESHQAEKTSVPGTAVNMAASLELGPDDIQSVRDPAIQSAALHIPEEHLDRHAYHRIEIEDAACSITMECRVYGAAPYAAGVSGIVSAVRTHELENRVYTITEFVEKGWV